ncbi:MAG: ATP-binding cassette domain-containing protein, partial [Oligoflexia bacterium]|nr:ATP-binding cassette domain-containing protein [Oligoflexia bacterium]
MNLINPRKFLALKDVSFKVEAHDFVGIIGPNGGGKSTLLRLILGELSPQQGKIEVMGKAPIKAVCDIGYVPQYVSFKRNFPISVFEVV